MVNDLVHSVIEILKTGGPIIIPIAGVNFLVYLYYFRLRSSLNTKLVNFPGTADMVYEKISSGESVAEVVESVNDRNVFFGRVTGYVLSSLEKGSCLSGLFDEIFYRENTFYNSNFSIMKALVSSAPLLGLTGTVLGMIETFQAISFGSSVPHRLMSEGISRALITTQLGLISAIPGIFLLNLLRKQYFSLERCLETLRLHISLSWRARA